MNPEKAEGLSPELQAALQPLLAGIESLSERIRECNERIEELAQTSYPQVLGAEAGGTWRQEREEASRDSDGTEARGVAASVVGEWRSVRTAAQQPPGIDAGGRIKSKSS